jgi:hypothetical protein
VSKERVGHTVARCYHRFDHAYKVSSPPAAFLTVNQSSPDINWYPDTASTHHLTNDLTNLNITANEYTGNEQIRVGNGQGLNILHTGRGGQNPSDPTNSLRSAPIRSDPSGFCALFHRYGLKYFKSARIGSGFGFNKKNLCEYPIRPVSTRYSTYLEQTL